MDIKLITTAFHRIEKKLPLAKLDDGISSPEYAGQLVDDLPSSEIALRYKLYRTMHTTFLASLFLQQAITQRIGQLNTLEESAKLTRFIQQLQQRQLKTSAWLTAIRKSGEEHYVGICHLNPTGDAGSKKEFWDSTLKPVVLTKLKELFCNEIYLNPEYMAVLRQQLDSNLDPS
jgi:hypothetical protein